MPTIRPATDDDMRAITSSTLEKIDELPHLYVPTDDPDVMRSRGVAHKDRIADEARIFPGCLVAPRFAGQTASRGDLLYHGAEPAAEFVSAS
jgi:hypothetical protein